MQKVGIIGGLGPEATMMYYRAIISQFQQHQGNQTTLPELMINSVNMYQMFAWLEKEDYTAVANYLSQAAQQLAAAGAVLWSCAASHRILCSTKFSSRYRC
ncbi:hypothetical protein AB0Y04_06210 [Loigolactobacillus coryniformis]